ncbi:MAG: preprotein translocase subunit SecE [Nitriliruptorales bacterium]
MSRDTRRQRAREERAAQRTEGQRMADQEALGRREGRTAPGEYLREVRGELRKVAWPNRREVGKFTVVVLVATAALMGIVFVMDFVFGRVVFQIFGG